MLGWRRIWRPAQYHGIGKRRNFFEGWYYKLVDASEQHAYAVIPGVFLGATESVSYCFVQTLDGSSGQTTFHRYPLADFQASRTKFDIAIGPNRFWADHLALAIDAPDRQMRGELALVGLKPWPVTLFSPGIMGWYAFVPLMECYHGVLSFDHRIDGRLQIDGRDLSFSGGRGYTEKDWGRSFPSAWIWLQSNHFGTEGTSLTASVATIPWLGSAFRGFIAGFWHRGQLYRFATYTGASIETLTVTDREVVWRVSGQAGTGPCRRAYRLEIVADRAEGGLLHAPLRQAMLPRVAESLTAKIAVRLWRREARCEQLVFDAEGHHAGMEINGELQKLTTGGVSHE